MGSGIQANTKGAEGNQRPGRAAHTAAGANRPGRKPKEEEPGINDANLFHILKVIFPNFLKKLSLLKDFRVKGRSTFSVPELVVPAVIERAIGNRSNRQHDLDKSSECFVDNMLRLSNGKTDRLPHSDTIRYFLEREESQCLAELLPLFFSRLLRDRRIGGMRCARELNGGKESFLIAVDGVHFHTSSAPLEHSTHRTHADGTSEYMLVALQATVVSPQGVRIPLMVEFIENPDGDYDKQDCELKACKRLLRRMKERFPHLSVILLLDGLYLCEDILKICRGNNWKYSITVTDHVSAFQEKALDAMSRKGHRVQAGDASSGCGRTVSRCNGIKHTFGDTDFTLNAIRMETTNPKGEKETLFYATDIFIHSKADLAVRLLNEVCRVRWQIEESFDEQKNHGLELETAFGTRGYAGQNYYLVVQFAYIILTFMRCSSLFRRLQQHENPDRIATTIQRSMLEWYGSVRNLMSRLRTALLARRMDDIDMSGWRLAFDTA